MTGDAELARCNREIAEIRNRPDVVAGETPAWLVVLGETDWEQEAEVITNPAYMDVLRARVGKGGQQ